MKFNRKRVLWLAAFVVLAALLGWRGYEYNDMRHHLKRLHVGMSYAEVREAQPSFLVRKELQPDREGAYSRYDYFMEIATPNRTCFLYFDDHLILQKLPAP